MDCSVTAPNAKDTSTAVPHQMPAAGDRPSNLMARKAEAVLLANRAPLRTPSQDRHCKCGIKMERSEAFNQRATQHMQELSAIDRV